MAQPERRMSAIPPNVPRTNAIFPSSTRGTTTKQKPRSEGFHRFVAFSLISQVSHPPELAPYHQGDRLPGFSGPFPSTTLNKMGPRAHFIRLWRAV